MSLLFVFRASKAAPEFAPPSRQILISPSAGANPLARKAPWARPSLRLPPVKALFHRRQAQTLWRERRRGPARVCASLPSKLYSTVGRRKPFGEKGAVGPPEFAPLSRQSLIPPSAGANPPARKAPCARLSLRLIPVKALSHRRQAQTLWRERRRGPARVCASLPSKPYPTVVRRKPFGEKGAVGPPEFAPPPRQSLILPPAGANPLSRKAPCARLSLRLPPVKALSTVGRRKLPGAPLLFFISSCNYHTVVYNDKCILALK